MPDLRFSLRAIRRSPLFATVAILSLALGIGANTAIFTLIDQLMLRQLPVKAPDQLVMLYQQGAHNGSNMGTRMHSYPMYQDFQKQGRAALRSALPAPGRRLRQRRQPDRAGLTPRWFPATTSRMLGVKPALGRVFNSQEDDRVYQRPSCRGPELRLLDEPLRARPEGGRQEDPREQLPHDDRRRVRRRVSPASIRRASPQIRVPDPDEGRDDAGVGLVPSGRPADPLGPGVRAAEAGLHRRIGAGTAAGTVHADPRVRDPRCRQRKTGRAYARDQFLQGTASMVEKRRRGLLGSAQRAFPRR